MINEKFINSEIEFDFISIVLCFEVFNKEKVFKNEDKVVEIVLRLKKKFFDIEYLNVKGEVVIISFYCFVLYL